MSSDGAKQQGGKAPAHPPYLDMVHEAIKALKDRTGSSGYAIKKYITQHYGKDIKDPNFGSKLSTALKNNTAKGLLVKVKSSYKLGEELKAKKPAAKKPKAQEKKKAGAKPKQAEEKPKKVADKPKKKAAAAPAKKAAAPKKAAAAKPKAAPAKKAKAAPAKKKTPTKKAAAPKKK